MYDETTPPNQLLARIAELEAQLAASELARAELAAARVASLPAPAERYRSPAAPRIGELRLRLALAAANMAVWEWDMLDDQVTWIGAPDRMFHIAGAEAGGGSAFWQRCIPPADLAALSTAINAAELDADVRIEHRYYRDDGSLGWIETLVRVVTRQHGLPARIVGVSTDISCNKQLEQALRRREQQFSTLVENLPNVIFRYRVVPDHTYEYVSPAVLRVTGYPPEAFYADPQIMTRLTHVDDRPLLESIDADMRSESPSRTHLIHRFYHQDGSLRWVELISTPSRNDAGDIVAYDGILHDITAYKQAVDALTAGERTLRLALAAGQLGTWEIDLATQQVSLSARHAALFGAAPSGGSLSLTELVARLHPDDRERGLVSMTSVVEGYSSSGLEVRVLQPDGKITWVRGRGQLLRNALGEPERIVGVLVDVTEERIARELVTRSNAELEQRVAARTLELEQANRELSENRRFLERVLAASPSRVHIFDYTTGGIVYSNASFTAQLGYTPEELAALGGPYPLAQLFHPDDLAAIPAQVARQHSMADDDVIEREFRMRHADGSWRWFVTYDVVFARDANGAPTQILGQVTEITGRKQIEAALKEAYTRLEVLNAELRHNSSLLNTIINSLSDALALIDVDGRLMMVNRSLGTLCGLAPATALGRDWRSLGLFQASAQLEQAITQGLTFSGREQLAANSTARVFDVQVFPLPEPNAGRQIVVRLVDVTEPLQLQSVLIQNERLAATGRLAAIVAHEVNSPLQAIQNFLFLAASDDRAERNAYLSMVANEIDRIGGLIRRLLNLQRPATTAVHPVELHGLITQVLALISGTLLRNRVRVHNELVAEPSWVTGRSDELTQVLLNLFINAIDAMPHGGALRVHSQQRLPLPADGFTPPLPALVAQIEVADTGPGLPANHLAQIFAPFYTTKPGGSGLGLSISSQIIEQHGGRLTAANAHPVGAVFCIVLPLSEPDLN